jgi:molybdate transport system substrate-binding protein
MMSSLSAHATTTIKIAAAANLTVPLATIIANFKSANPGYDVTAVYDSSGVLEAQINGTCAGGCSANAPGYDLYLAADVDHPKDLIDNYSGSVYSYDSGKTLINYAIGTLVLYSNTTGVNVSSGLPSGWSHVAIAVPSAAPYGKAAAQVLDRVYGIHSLPDPKVDQYSNITNTYNAVQNGSPPSELYGFVALSQVCTQCNTSPVFTGTSHQVIASGPSTYDEIVQGGVQVARSRSGAEQTELDAFVQFLTGKDYSYSAVSPNGTATLLYYGYTLPSDPYPVYP